MRSLRGVLHCGSVQCVWSHCLGCDGVQCLGLHFGILAERACTCGQLFGTGKVSLKLSAQG
jgi:hypothetical protein